MNYFDMHDQELPDCGARVILANDVSATCALPAGHLGPHASSNRVCTCVDAGYVIGSDPNCPRHAIPNSAAKPHPYVAKVWHDQEQEAQQNAQLWEAQRQAGRATPNRVLELEDDEEQRIVVGALEQYADTKRYTVAASTADRKMLDRQGAIAKSLAQRLT